MEVENRNRTRIERSIKTAGFYTMKTLEGFQFDEVTVPAGLSPESLKSLRFIAPDYVK
ncbi:MAG: hypothetical protein JEZ04_13740 [Spirochaetales bacterium]|nr:hypothetical protein [Spirochaetales bacterium]